MEYWIAHKNARVIEQVICEDDETPRWSTDAQGADYYQVTRHGDLLAEFFDVATGAWELSVAYAWQQVRQVRNRLLQEGDFPPLYARPEAQQPAYIQYMQELRDLPQTLTDPFNPVYPVRPW